MTEFEKWSFYYSKKWATKAQLQQVVSYGKLTPEEYQTITDDEYPAV